MACGGTCGCKECGASSPQVRWPDGARAASEACGCGGWVEPPSHDPRGVPAGLGASGAQFGVSPPSATRRARGSIAAADAASSSMRLAVPRVAGPFEPVDADPVGALARADAGARRAPRLRAASAFEPQDATMLAAFGSPRSRRRGAVTAPDTQVPRDRPTRRGGSGVASPGMHWDPRIQQGEVRLPDGMGSADRPGEIRPPQAVEDRPSPEDLAILHRTHPAPTVAPPDGAVVATAPSVADRGEVAAGLRRGGDASPSGPARAAIPYGTAAGAGRQDLGELGGSGKRGKGGGGGGAGGAAPAGSPPIAPQVGGAPGPGLGNPVAPGGGGAGPGNPPAPKPPAVTTPSCDCTCTCEPDGTTTLRIQTTPLTLDANGQAVPDRPVQYPIVLGPPVSPIRNGLPLLAPAGTTLGGTKVGGFHTPVAVPPQSVAYGAAAGMLGAADDTGRVSPVGFPGTPPYDPPDDRGSALALEVGSGQLTQIVLARAEAGARMDAVGRTGIQATAGADGPGVQSAFSQTAASQTAAAGPGRALRGATGVFGVAPAAGTPGAAGTAGGASTGFHGIRGPGGALGDALPPPPAGEPERGGRGDPPPGAPPPGPSPTPPGSAPIGAPPPTPPPPTFVAGGGGGSRGSALNAEEIARPPLWSDEPPQSRPAPPPRSPALHPAGAFGGDAGLLVPSGALSQVGTLHPGGSSPLQWQSDPTATRSRRTLAPFGGAGTLDRRDAPTDARRLHAGGGMDAGARVRPPVEAAGTQATVPRYLAEFDALNTGGQKGGLDDPFGWGGASAGDTQRGGLSRVTVDWLAVRGGHPGAAPTPVAPSDVAGTAVRASLGNDLPGAGKRGVAQAARGPGVAGGVRTSVDEAAVAERDAQFVLPAAPPASGGNPAAQFPVASREPTGPRGLAPGGTFATTPPRVDREWEVRSPQGGHLGSSRDPAAEHLLRTAGARGVGGGSGGLGGGGGGGGGGGAAAIAAEQRRLAGAQHAAVLEARDAREDHDEAVEALRDPRNASGAAKDKFGEPAIVARNRAADDAAWRLSRAEAAVESLAMQAKDLHERESAALVGYVTANPTDGFKRFNEEKARERARGVADGRLAANQREQASRANDRRAAKWKAALPFEAFRERADAQAESELGLIRAREADLRGLKTQQDALKAAPDLDADGRKVLAGLLADEARRGAEMGDLAKRKERIAHGKAERTADSERRAAKVAAKSHASAAEADDRAFALAKLEAEDKLQAELSLRSDLSAALRKTLADLRAKAVQRILDRSSLSAAQATAAAAGEKAQAAEQHATIHALRDLAGKSASTGTKGHADAALFKGLIGDLKKSLLSPADIARILSQPQSAWAAAREALRRQPPAPAGRGPRIGGGKPGLQPLGVATVYPEGSRGDASAVVVQFAQILPDLSGGVRSAGTPQSPPQVPADPCSPSCYASAPCPCPPGQKCKCSPKAAPSGGGSDPYTVTPDGSRTEAPPPKERRPARDPAEPAPARPPAAPPHSDNQPGAGRAAGGAAGNPCDTITKGEAIDAIAGVIDAVAAFALINTSGTIGGPSGGGEEACPGLGRMAVDARAFAGTVRTEVSGAAQKRINDHALVARLSDMLGDRRAEELSAEERAEKLCIDSQIQEALRLGGARLGEVAAALDVMMGALELLLPFAFGPLRPQRSCEALKALVAEAMWFVADTLGSFGFYPSRQLGSKLAQELTRSKIVRPGFSGWAREPGLPLLMGMLADLAELYEVEARQIADVESRAAVADALMALYELLEAQVAMSGAGSRGRGVRTRRAGSGRNRGPGAGRRVPRARSGAGANRSPSTRQGGGAGGGDLGNRGTVRTGEGTAGTARRTGVPDGTADWSNKPGRMSSAENAAEHASNHASEFGLSHSDYLDAAHRFVSEPPATAEVFVRPSGEVMIYDPPTNTFAVRTPEGAPATFMKPGPGYWERQLTEYGGRRTQR